MRKNGEYIKCISCGKLVYKIAYYLKRNARYCSLKCLGIHKSKLAKAGKWKSPTEGNGKGVIVICPRCKKKTYRNPSRKNRVYCSRECWYMDLGETLKDENLRRDYVKRWNSKDNGKYERTQEWRKRASDIAKENYRTGKLKPRMGAASPFWKGGISTLQNRERQKPEYKAWRKAVYERDGYKCVKCGATRYLHAHHIKEFSKYPELRYEVSNGLTVCRDCHSKIHGRFIPNIGDVNKNYKFSV